MRHLRRNTLAALLLICSCGGSGGDPADAQPDLPPQSGDEVVDAMYMDCVYVYGYVEAPPSGACEDEGQCRDTTVKQTCPEGSFGRLTTYHCRCTTGAWSCAEYSHTKGACRPPLDAGSDL